MLTNCFDLKCKQTGERTQDVLGEDMGEVCIGNGLNAQKVAAASVVDVSYTLKIFPCLSLSREAPEITPEVSIS